MLFLKFCNHHLRHFAALLRFLRPKKRLSPAELKRPPQSPVYFCSPAAISASRLQSEAAFYIQSAPTQAEDGCYNQGKAGDGRRLLLTLLALPLKWKRAQRSGKGPPENPKASERGRMCWRKSSHFKFLTQPLVIPCWENWEAHVCSWVSTQGSTVSQKRSLVRWERRRRELPQQIYF